MKTTLYPLLLAVLATPLAGQEPVAVGSEFQVNVHTTGSQVDPAVAVDPAGRLMVVWADTDPSAGVFSTVQGRMFGSDGNPASDGLRVSAYPSTGQAHPSVAADGSGRFVVVWQENGIRGRRFAADGSASGEEFQIASGPEPYHIRPSVAASDDGRFVVTWTRGYGDLQPDDSRTSIWARRFGSDGSPLGEDFQVNSYDTGVQRSPAVAMDADGNFVVAWSSSTDYDYYHFSLQAQRFDSGGSHIGGEFQVSSPDDYDHGDAAVSATADGRFVVVWQRDGSPDMILGRLFAADGTALGSELRVDFDSPSSPLPMSPSVAIDPTGSFVAVWSNFGSNGDDDVSTSIQMRRFGADGSPIHDATQVNSYTLHRQVEPAVASDADGDFVVVWTSGGSAGTDDSEYSIQGQRFRAFCTDDDTLCLNRSRFEVEVDWMDFRGATGSGRVVGFRGDDSGLLWFFDAENWEMLVKVLDGCALNGHFWVFAAGEPESLVKGQRFGSDGTAVGGELQISDRFSPGFSALAGEPQAGFVVVWTAPLPLSPGSNAFGTDIAARRLTPDGVSLGGDFIVNSFTTGNQYRPSAALAPDGRFVVVWESNESSGTDDFQGAILGRRVSSDGTPSGEDFQVNKYTSSVQQSPSVAYASTGDFLVVWSSNGSEGPDRGRAIEAQLFSADGNRRGGEFQVNTSTSLREYAPWIITAPDGGFLVVWTASEPFTGEWRIAGRRLTAEGHAVGDEFSVAAGAATLSAPTLAAATDGRLVAVWGSDDTSGPDTSFSHIEGRRLLLSCTDNDTLCLTGSRFEVEVEWQDFAGNTGRGRTVPFLSDDSGLFWFFSADNWEMLVKVLDGCAVNDRFWVFAAATTTVEYTLRVTDTVSGSMKTYVNPLGNAADALTDTSAFATCP